MPDTLAPITAAADASQFAAVQQAEPLMTDEEFGKLKERVKNSYDALAPYRASRLKTIKQYAGNSLGSSGEGSGTYSSVVNPLAQMVNVYMQLLVSGNPQCLVVTNKLALKFAARSFNLALNHVLKAIDVRNSARFGVLESLFSMMIMKVGVENPEYTEKNYPFDVSAMPFAEAVWFEDWVHDTSVNRLELCRFMGDKYKEHKDVILSDPRNDPDVAQNIDSGPEGAFDTGGNQESADDLNGKKGAFDTEKDDMVPLWDIYLPRKKLVVTYPVNGSDKPLRVMKWTGPPQGPYKVGRYDCVLNQIMPKAPAVDGAELAALDNRLFEKIGRQSSRQKTLTFATLQGQKDAQTIVNASDGETVNVINPEAVRTASYGGVDQGTVAFEQVVRQRASLEWGNLDTMGGLTTGADTLGQEQMLQQASNGRIRSMQQEVIRVMKEVITDIGWYIWNDPLVQVSVMDKLPGTDIQMELQWPQQADPTTGNMIDMRKGEYNDFNFEIVPFSMQDQSPQSRLNFVKGLWETSIMPMAQILMQEGKIPNADHYLKLVAQYSGMQSELEELITDMSGQVDPEQTPVNDAPPKPAGTTRQYERVVRPKGNDGGAGMIAALSGGGGNNKGNPAMGMK